MLRRRTLAANSIIIIAASGLMTPIAVYMAVGGNFLPLLIAAMALFSGMMTLSMHQHGRFEEAVAGQVHTLLGIGLILTLADPALADSGLAIALLAPIHASLLARPNLRKLAWLLLLGTAILAVNASALHGAAGLSGPGTMEGLSLLCFAIGAGVVAHSAHRIGNGFAVYDKSQLAAYKHLVEHVQDAVIRFSSDGEILFLSRSSETLFGCRRYEMTGSGMGERIHVMDRPAYLTAFADANQGGKPRTIEVRMRQDDPGASVRVPRFIWVEVSLSPVVEGAIAGLRFEVVALFRDVTERRDQAAAMAEARKIAEEASIAKSRFLATIGHELRTPLNAVVGFSEMMTSGIGGEMSPTHLEYAGLIHQSGTHLLEVVRMLLDMSRIEAGKFELQTEAFAPEALLQPCLKMVEGAALKRDIVIRTDLGRTLPQLVADERACRQILINLLSNAVKFSNDGGTVTVSVKRQGQHLNLSVSDQGIGMSPGAVLRIGEPFFQADEGLSRKYEGTGLGLSIVKGLVELHEGTLHAISEFGVGTTMTVLLPINGPAIKPADTGNVTPLHPEPAPSQTIPWQDEKRKAL
ncbi:PAS domain-containing sensor histidine kinase [Devosia sp.]|uniref:PAS domain-containing sensor histidine kinase n=1 Tax=Devosia sp. TaxID=1871048 RepID=UPI0032644026